MDVDAVTIDAFGTVLGLRDPVPALRRALTEHGVDRDAAAVAAAFAAEAAYYTARSHDGRDEATLARLRRDCAAVFLTALDAQLDPDEFAPVFVGALVFEALPGAVEACRALAAAGLRLAVVSNWDIALHDQLKALPVDAIVTSAEAGAPKPGPRVFELALELLGIPPNRAVHVGDSADDEEGARAAGLRFEPAPLADAARRILA